MLNFKRFALGLVACAAIAAAAIEEEDGVLVLDDSNFDEAVKANDALLVEFYAPWCGHCKRLAPEYAAAAQKLKGEPVRLAKVDATEARDLATRFGIQGFPTLKFFRGDAENAVEYNGGREADGIVSWLRKKVGPVTRPLASVEEASTFADAADVVVIGFFAAGSEGEKAYSRVAANYEDITFGLTSSDEVRAAYGVAAGTSAIVAVNKFPGQENKVSFTGNVEDERSIATFVDGNSLPLVIPFSQENAPKIFRGPIKTHFLLFVDPASADYEQTVTALRGVATGYTGRLLFVTVDPSQDRVVSFFGVSAADMPTAVIVHMPEGESMKKFKMTAGTAITEQNMKAFVQDYQAGSLKPHLKSDPAPDAAAEAAAPVKTVVGTTFANIVLDTNKDVLLEFYAPWCGHCKSLAPEYERLGQKFASVDSVVIAKIDATANEVDYPGVNVRGFPTILFFPAGSKQVVEYDGSRDVDGFVAFLKKNAAKPFSLTDEDDLEL